MTSSAPRSSWSYCFLSKAKLKGEISRVSSLMTTVIIALAANAAFAQTNVGIQPLASYANHGLDSISLGTLGLHVDIPLYQHKAKGAGMGVNVDLVYDTSYLSSPKTPIEDYGWRVVQSTAPSGSVIVTKISSEFVPQQCEPGITPCNAGHTDTVYGFSFIDSTGFEHSFGESRTSILCRGKSPEGCTNQNLQGGNYAEDGSGYYLSVNPLVASPSPLVVTVTTPSGTVYDKTFVVTDTNGNVGVSDGTRIPQADGKLTDNASVSVTITGGSYNTADWTKWSSRTPTLIQYLDTSGNTQTITINYSVPAVGATAQVTSVVYPDSTSYAFTYQSDGQLQSAKLPTGGKIKYVTGTLAPSPGDSFGVGLPATMTRTDPDGVTSYSQTTTSNPSALYEPATSTTTITNPNGTVETVSFVYVFTYDSSVGSKNYNYETAHTWSAKDGTLLKSKMTCYNLATGDCITTPITFPISRIVEITTVDGLTSQTLTTLNSLGLVTQKLEYDFNPTATTYPLRETDTVYAALGNHIADRPSSVTVYDNTGNIASETGYSYDSTGNLTDRSTLIDLGGQNSAPTHSDTYFTYDSAGQLLTVKDPKNYITTNVYDSATGNCIISTTPPAVPSGVSLATSSTCDANTGLPISSTDANGVTATLTYDSMLRVTASETRDASGTLIARAEHDYGGSSLPRILTTTVTATPSPDEVSTSILDGLGRATSVTAPSGTTVSTAYNSMGQVQSISNPYLSGSDSSYGVASYLYDGLGRKSYQCQPDNGTPATACSPLNSYQQWTYSGASVTFKDEVGNQWQRTSDGLGRLTKVLEPSSTSQSPTLETDYVYDAINNLKSVVQQGTGTEAPRTRYFGYDLMSRLLWSYNPESGVVCYGTGVGNISSTGVVTGCNADGYDLSGNLQYKTDARGVQTSYFYDSLNRLTAKTYSGQTGDANSSGIAAATPETHYIYDLNPSGTTAYAKGRLVTEVTGSLVSPVTTHTVGTYDAMGRVLIENESLAGYPVSSSPTRFYDLAGNLVYSDNGLGSIAFNSVYDSSGRLQMMTSTWDDATHPKTLLAPPLTGLQYGPVGLLGANYGIPSTSGTPIFTQKRVYNNRARLTDELNTMGGPATAGSGYVIFTDGDLNHRIVYRNHLMTVPDTGTITALLSVPGASSPVYMGLLDYSGESMSDLASEVADKLNNTDDQGNPPVVHATVSLTQTNPSLPQVNITSLITGAASNYTFSLAYNPDIPDANDYPYSTSGLDLTGGQDASPTQELYHYGLTYKTSGNVDTVTDSVIGNWGYTYDPLNRLTSAQASAYPSTLASPYGAGLLGWSYDSFGNFLGQTFTGYSHATVTQTPFSYTSGNNLADGTQYDASGNVTSNGAMALFYDAEGRLSSTGQGTIYVYDAEGRRLAKESAGSNGGAATVTNYYILGSGGEQLSELDGSGNWLHSNAYANGRLLATYDASGVHFHFTDWLGTNRVQASGTGQVEQRCLSLPFGDGLSCDRADSTEQHFTGKERDTESGLDYFGARNYSSQSGRWMSPDPSNLGVDIFMPQSWNRYNYALNNPVNFADGNGLWPFYIHNKIIKNAFPGLSADGIKVLDDASWSMDFDEGQQDPTLAFEHGMRNGLTHQNSMEAQQQGDRFIWASVGFAQQEQAAWIAQGHKGISPKALSLFGNALHTVTDRTSPAHEDNQPWRNEGTFSSSTQAHVKRELSISPDRMRQATSAARQLFIWTFGTELGNDASQPPDKLPKDKPEIDACKLDYKDC